MDHSRGDPGPTGAPARDPALASRDNRPQGVGSRAGEAVGKIVPGEGVRASRTGVPVELREWSVSKQIRKWHALSLLCRSGAGLAAITPQVCRLLRELVGADAAALFWMNENGLPDGFFHEDSPASAREVFLNAFEELFIGPDELNVAMLARKRGRPGGHLLAPGADYFRSNTFNLLVRASGHQHSLDLRIDIDGRARAIVLLFRTPPHAFSEADLATLSRAADPITQALKRNAAGDDWTAVEPVGHLVVAADGSRVLMATARAEELIRMSNRVGAGIALTGPLAAPPAFVADLLGGPTGAWGETVPVPSGRLRVMVDPMRAPGGGEAAALVSLALETPRHLARVDRVLTLDLSPRRREIALAAAGGATRREAAADLGLSEEAMKKHLAALYAATGTHSWEELVAVLA